MFPLRRLLLVILSSASAMVAQPALTTIQDILYKADGTRFSGTMNISWNSFQSGDAADIATSNLTVTIVNGVLNVQLVPTTDASAGANYQVSYNSNGAIQFTETWAIPPSTVPLRVSAVRVSQGTVVGPAPITGAPIQISDVVGLENVLANLPEKGIGFTLSRAAIIDQSGMIDGAAGTLGDCVHVDGSSGPCGGGGGLLPLFSNGEVPSGTVNGSNTVFTLAFVPSPASSLNLFLNGLLLDQGQDYTLSGQTITFLTVTVPQSGDLLQASYQYANPNNPLGSLTASQVVCSSPGAGTSASALTQLGSCTIPAGLLGAGDRIEISFQYSHSGTVTGFTGVINWGGTTLVSRSTAASETVFVGKADIGVVSSGQYWDAQSWGGSLGFATSVGAASQNITSAITISFQGEFSGSTSDTLNLENFTVIRYPAQSNP